MALSNIDIELQKRYQERLQAKTLHHATYHVMLRDSEAFQRLELLVEENNDLLRILIEEIESIKGALSNKPTKSVTTKNVAPKSVTTKDVAAEVTESNLVPSTNELLFDIEKSKAIAVELRGQGLTANEISKELAQRGYGNQKGKPFSQGSVGQWFLKRNAKKPIDKLQFDTEKSKAIAIELKGQGLTANEIAQELARRGYGNKNGTPFLKGSIHKWFLKKNLESLNNESATDSQEKVVTSNEQSVAVATDLQFDIGKSKVIAVELKEQGLTANEISQELARRGYVNKNGKPFLKGSIYKWFLKKK